MRKLIGRFALAAFILLALGCHNKMSSEELQAMQNDCKRNIFHNLTFVVDYKDRQKPLVVQHIKDGKMIDEFIIESDKNENYITERTVYGDDAYLLKINNKVIALTELKGGYNPRCSMFGCNPGCVAYSYKIDNQKRPGMDINLYDQWKND